MWLCACTGSDDTDVSGCPPPPSAPGGITWLPENHEERPSIVIKKEVVGLPMGTSSCEIIRHERIIETGLFTRLQLELSQLGFFHGWRSNTSIGFGHWNRDFVKSIKENGVDVGNRLLSGHAGGGVGGQGSGCVAEAWFYLRDKYYQDYILLRCYMNGHVFGLEGYPHTDSIRPCDKTLVVYMNKTWRREWGGETMIYGEGSSILHAELPKENSAIEFPGCAWHVARGVTRICPELRVTLVFKLAPKGVDPRRDDIQRLLLSLGCEHVKHGGGTLVGHLLRVYDHLKLAACDDDVCGAGAVHSVFGTSRFRERVLDAADGKAVASVAAVVGQASADLALLFGQIARPAELERALSVPICAGEEMNLRTYHQSQSSTVAVSGKQILQLCSVECANLHDQQHSFSNYPFLQAHWRSLSD